MIFRFLRTYMKHLKKTLVVLLCLGISAGASALDIKPASAVDTVFNPDIVYSPIPKTYEIADIRVSGVPSSDDYLIIGYSGLSVGDRIDIPAKTSPEP